MLVHNYRIQLPAELFKNKIFKNLKCSYVLICILFINWYFVKIYTKIVSLLTSYIVSEYKKSMKRWNNISTFLKYNVRIWYTLKTWINKRSMCLIGHLNNCNVAFRVYIHVYYTIYTIVIEFSLNFPGFKKNPS